MRKSSRKIYKQYKTMAIWADGCVEILGQTCFPQAQALGELREMGETLNAYSQEGELEHQFVHDGELVVQIF